VGRAAQQSRTLLRYTEHIVIDEPPLYDVYDVYDVNDVNDAGTTQQFSAVPLMTIGWSELLPTKDKQILSRYEQNLLTEQVVLSVQAMRD
jgi:hypothetical protein